LPRRPHTARVPRRFVLLPGAACGPGDAEHGVRRRPRKARRR